jgi:hypothetical protein
MNRKSSRRRRSKPISKNGSAKRNSISRSFLEALTGKAEDAYRRALDAIAMKRRDPKISLSKAARARGTTIPTIRKYAGSAIEVRSGRIDVTLADRLPRPMRILTPQGEFIVRTTSSRTASRIGEHNNAIRIYVLTGDTSELKRFEGKIVRSGGKTYGFATDKRTLDKFARAGAIHVIDIYFTGGKK